MKVPSDLRVIWENYERRSFLTSAVSFFSTIAFLLYNLFLGLRFHVPWNLSISFYYLILVILHAWVLFSERCWKKLNPAALQIRRTQLFRVISRLLILIDIGLLIPISLMVLSKRSVHMGEISAIAVAAYTSYKVGISITGYQKARRSDNKSLQILKMLNLKNAMVSVLTLQNTMVMVFGSGESMLMLTAYTSAGMLILMIAFTVIWIRKA